MRIQYKRVENIMIIAITMRALIANFHSQLVILYNIRKALQRMKIERKIIQI